jgi:hypothetical protein
LLKILVFFGYTTELIGMM